MAMSELLKKTVLVGIGAEQIRKVLAFAYVN